MRLAAAARLLAQFESVKRDPKTKDDPHGAVSPQSKDLKDLLHASQLGGQSAVPWDPLYQKEQATKTRSHSQGLLINQKSSWDGVLRNFRKKNRGRKVEENLTNAKLCDPTLDEADVGLLSCGFNYYCAESRDSYLGGVCVEVMDSSNHRRRELSSYVPIVGDTEIDFVSACDPSSPYFSQCDCTMFDGVSGNGYIKCLYYENRCLEACPTVCLDHNVGMKITSNMTGTSTSCFGISGSYEREVCYTFLENDYECSISLDGTTCNRCELDTCVNAVDTYSFLIWDCTNAPNGTEGSWLEGNQCGYDGYNDYYGNYGHSILPALSDCTGQTPAPAPRASVVPSVGTRPSASAGPTSAPVVDESGALTSPPSSLVGPTKEPTAVTNAPVVSMVEPTKEPTAVTNAPVVGMVEPTKVPTAVTNAPVVAAPPSTSGSVYFGAGSSVLILSTGLVAGVAIALGTGG